MSLGRRATVDTIYGGSNITSYISRFMESFSYTDVASGASDSISVTLHDVKNEWGRGWTPAKGDRIANICYFNDWAHDGDNWFLICGNFEVDDITLSGMPRTVSFGGASIPVNELFNAEERTKTWENVSVQEIAGEIAARAGIAMYYEAETIVIESLEQDKQTDCKFLYSVCSQYGLAMKVFYDKVIIFDEGIYENRAPVITLLEKDIIDWKYNTTLSGTYTGAKISYSDPGTGDDHEVVVGGGSRILNINKTADNAEDARKKAISELNNANKKAETMSIVIMARKNIVSAACIGVAGLGLPDGNYYIDKVVTKVSGKGASQQTLTVHKTGYRFDDATIVLENQPENNANGSSSEYTVVKGDTLWGIAQKLLNSPLRYAEIYDINKDVIESAAKERGKKDSSNGHWLFPGTVLTIPPAEEDS